jgi:phosphate acyltransferase
MPNSITIAIDAMGGDHAPESVMAGIEIVAKSRPGVRYQIHGDPARINALLATMPAAKASSTIVPADRAIGMEIKPSQALRQGKGSSMWNAVAAVEEGTANAVVSAGNTGALMAIAMMRLRMMQGVHRPALVASWPTMTGICCVLDVGANVGADARQLVEFAVMGEAFFRAVHGVERPSVGLLNVGAEDQKGHEEIRAAAKLIREANLDLAFHGFVEGDDIGKGTVDVVVTDGFSGNIALKTAEGTARLVGHFLKEALTGGPFAKIGALIAYPALRKLKKRMDPGRVNGGVFLGVNGLVVKSHGGADAAGFAAAVDVAIRMARSAYREEIAAKLAPLASAAIAALPATGTDAS